MPGALDPDDGGQQLLLGKMLLERGLITPDQLREALVERARSVSDGDRQTTPLGGILVRKGYLTDSQLLGLMAEQNGDAPAVVPPYEKTAIAAPMPSGPQLPALTVPDPMADGGALGKYKLVRELGRGGMGVVYEAVDSQLNRKVALKLMLSNPNADPKERALEEERFVQEAQLSAKLKHPNIVTVYEAGLLDGRQFLSMEMIEGSAFNEWRKTVTIRQQIQTLADVASAVHHAHEQGILHRDLKPRNILVSGSGHAYVTDFGLAKSLGKNVHHSLTGSGAVVGTPAYMSPEQAQGLDRVDWRTDIYSLGVILYECMTGRTPFTGESPIEILMKVVKDPVTPPLQLVDAGSALGLDKVIENICLKALAKKDRDRYVTAQAFSDDLSKWLAGEKVHVVIPKTKSAKGSRRVYMLAGLLLMALAGGLVWLGLKGTTTSVKPYLESGKKYMAEENYSEALIQYRVALANDPANVEATMGVKAAQDAIAKKERDREEKLKQGANKKYTEWEEKQLQVEALLRAEQAAATEEKQRELAEQRRNLEADAKRLKEEADKAEEEFRRTQSYILTNTPGNTDAWKDAINLLPMVDPRRNSVLGTWDVQEKGQLTVDRTPFARAEIPFVLPQEYDFQMVFERRTGCGGVSIILSKVGRQFRLELGGESNTRSGLEIQLPNKPAEMVAVQTDPRVLLNDTKYVALVQVRTGGVKAFLNDKLVVDWKTDFKDVSLNPQWKMRSPLRLGIGSHESETVFHRIALLEVSGKGRRLEYTAPPPLKAQQVAPGTLKPGLVGEYFLGTGFQALAMRRVDATVDFKWGEGSAWTGGPTDSFSVRWSGFLHVPQGGKYLFTASADDGVRLFIDEQQVLASWNSRTDTARTIEVALEGGYHRIVLEYFEMAYLASMVLSWSTSPNQAPMPIQQKSLFHAAADSQVYVAPKSPDIAGALPPNTQNVNAVAYDPMGKLVAVAGEDRRVRIYDSGTLKEVGSPLAHPSGVLCVAFSPDGLTLATGARDNKVRIWEVQNRTELKMLEGPTSFIQCLAFSPDGKLVAGGSYDKSIHVWTIETPETPQVLAGHTRGVESLSFSRDGKTLASAAMEGSVKVWDLASGKELRTLQGHADSVEAVLYSPGGRALATAGADGLIKLWDDKGADLKTLAGHGEEIMSLAFSPDGLRLAAGGNDGMIRIWNPVEGKVLKLIPAHTSRVTSLAFAPSGRILASASADATVRFWNVDK